MKSIFVLHKDYKQDFTTLIQEVNNILAQFTKRCELMESQIAQLQQKTCPCKKVKSKKSGK